MGPQAPADWRVAEALDEEEKLACAGCPSGAGDSRADGGSAYGCRVARDQLEREQRGHPDAARGRRCKVAQTGDAAQATVRSNEAEFTRRARLSWAKLLRPVYKVDPLLQCHNPSSCNQGTLNCVRRDDAERAERAR